MAEYLIQEETLTEIADIVREKFEYYDIILDFIQNRTQSFTSIVIPDSVTSIGESAFANCGKLENVTFGNNVKIIDRLAFRNTAISNIVIPDSVTSIGDQSFSYCKKLESVIIGSGVTIIEIMAFNDCTSLTDIYLRPAIPPTLETTNAISTATTTIHVPVGSGDAYKSATNWANFANIIIEDIVIE